MATSCFVSGCSLYFILLQPPYSAIYRQNKRRLPNFQYICLHRSLLLLVVLLAASRGGCRKHKGAFSKQISPFFRVCKCGWVHLYVFFFNCVCGSFSKVSVAASIFKCALSCRSENRSSWQVMHECGRPGGTIMKSLIRQPSDGEVSMTTVTVHFIKNQSAAVPLHSPPHPPRPFKHAIHLPANDATVLLRDSSSCCDGFWLTWLHLYSVTKTTDTDTNI